MSIHRESGDAQRLRRAIERWENEGGHVSAKGENLPGRPQRPAQRRVLARPEGSLASTHTKSHGTV